MLPTIRYLPPSGSLSQYTAGNGTELYGVRKKLLQQQRRPLPASSSSETLHIQSAYSTNDNAQTVPIPFRPQLGCLQEQHLGVLQPSSFHTPFRQSSTT